MTVDTQNSQIELKIQRGIRQAEDELVKSIQDALNLTRTYGNLEESQFRNLVRVADTTESVEVIKNFLRYQVGRDDKWGKGKDSLANKIIADIDGTLSNLADNIAKDADPKADNNAKDTKVSAKKDIHIKLIRLYLGYGARYLTYLRKGKS